MLEVLYSSGLRAAELIGMNLADIDLRQGTILVRGKGRKERLVPVGATARRVLTTYLRAVRPSFRPAPGEDGVFLDRSGHRLRYHTLRRNILRVAAAAGMDGKVTAHVFRRSCATELVRGNANLYHVSRLLGHESLDTLQHYAKLDVSDLRRTHHRTHPRERDEAERGAL
jgi:integrase/recombinase XerD